VTKGFFFNWLAGIGLIYGLNFAIGNWMFGNTGNALIYLLFQGLGSGGFGTILYLNLMHE
jgi:hypothetical protein